MYYIYSTYCIHQIVRNEIPIKSPRAFSFSTFLSVTFTLIIESSLNNFLTFIHLNSFRFEYPKEMHLSLAAQKPTNAYSLKIVVIFIFVYFACFFFGHAYDILTVSLFVKWSLELVRLFCKWPNVGRSKRDFHYFIFI